MRGVIHLKTTLTSTPVRRRLGCVVGHRRNSQCASQAIASRSCCRSIPRLLLFVEGRVGIRHREQCLRSQIVVAISDAILFSQVSVQHLVLGESARPVLGGGHAALLPPRALCVSFRALCGLRRQREVRVARRLDSAVLTVAGSSVVQLAQPLVVTTLPRNQLPLRHCLVLIGSMNAR